MRRSIVLAIVAGFSLDALSIPLGFLAGNAIIRAEETVVRIPNRPVPDLQVLRSEESLYREHEVTLSEVIVVVPARNMSFRREASESTLVWGCSGWNQSAFGGEYRVCEWRKDER